MDGSHGVEHENSVNTAFAEADPFFLSLSQISIGRDDTENCYISEEVMISPKVLENRRKAKPR